MKIKLLIFLFLSAFYLYSNAQDVTITETATETIITYESGSKCKLIGCFDYQVYADRVRVLYNGKNFSLFPADFGYTTVMELADWVSGQYARLCPEIATLPITCADIADINECIETSIEIEFVNNEYVITFTDEDLDETLLPFGYELLLDGNVIQLINIDGDVVSSVTIPEQYDADVTSNNTGNTIATFTDENGDNVGINESVTTISTASNADGTATSTITNELGVQETITYCPTCPVTLVDTQIDTFTNVDGDKCIIDIHFLSDGTELRDTVCFKCETEKVTYDPDGSLGLPTNAIEGDTYITNNSAYTYDGTTWIIDPDCCPVVNNTPLTFVVSPTGNTSNFNQFVVDSNGNQWYIDDDGDGYLWASSGGTTSSLVVSNNIDGTRNLTHDDGTGNVVDVCLDGVLQDHSGATLIVNCSPLIFNEDISLTDDTNVNTTGIGVSGAEFSDNDIVAHTTETNRAVINSTNATVSRLNSTALSSQNALIDVNYSIVSGRDNQAIQAATGVGQAVFVTGRFNINDGGNYAIIGGQNNTNISNPNSLTVGNSNSITNGGASVNSGTSNVLLNTTEGVYSGDTNSSTDVQHSLVVGTNNVITATLNANISGTQNNVNVGSGSVVSGIGLTLDNAILNFVGGDQNTLINSTRNSVVGLTNTLTGSNSNNVSGVSNTLTNWLGSVVSGQQVTLSDGAYSTAIGQNITSTAGRVHLFGIDMTNSFPDVFMVDLMNTSTLASTQTRQVMMHALDYTLFSDAAQTTGVNLATGSSSWAGVSARRFKENFNYVDYNKMWEEFKDIDITKWTYKGSDNYHIGIMADDFYKLAGGEIGEEYNLEKIETMDADGVLFSLLKASQEKINQLEKRIYELENN